MFKDFNRYNIIKRNRNKLKKIWDEKNEECKAAIKQEEIDQLWFHFQNMFQGMGENKYISLGYIHTRQDNRKPIFKFWSFKVGEISDNIIRRILMLSRRHVVYISQCTFSRTRRLAEYVYGSKSFILDLDYYNIDAYKNLTPEQMMKVLELDGMFDIIKPAYAYASGRGLSLVYIFKDSLPVGLNDRVKSLRKHIAKNMIKTFEKYGADPTGSDLARINKLPGSCTQNRKKKQNIIEQTRFVSDISANDFTNSRDFLATVNKNIEEWTRFHEDVAFWKAGDPIPEGIIPPNTPYCSLVEEYIADKVYILNFSQIKASPLHVHSVDELASFFLPENKNEYLARLKAEDHKKWEAQQAKWAARKNKGRKNPVTKTLQTLCSLRVQDIFTLCLERAKQGLRQYRKSALFITAHLLAAQYNYHEGNNLNGALKEEEIREVLLRLNDIFTRRYDETMINDIINELVHKFKIAISEGKTEGKDDNRFYHFTNNQIIAEMRITATEEKKMSVTISSNEKKERYTMRKLREKRNRAKAKEGRIMQHLFVLKNYLQQHKTGKQISELMNISLRTVNRLKAKLRETEVSVIDAFIETLERAKEKTENALINNLTLKDQKLAHSHGQISFMNMIEGFKNKNQEIKYTAMEKCRL